MGHKVLKSFPYAADGITTRQTSVDEILENVNPAHVPGLIAAGLIATTGTPAEAASKAAGEAIAATDLAGAVDSDKAVHEQIDDAKSRISDGLIGAPEARSIVDEHKLEPLPSAEVVQAAQDEKAAHEAGDTTFDPKSPEAVEAAKEKVEANDGKAEVPADEKAPDPLDHDGDGKKGGSKPRK